MRCRAAADEFVLFTKGFLRITPALHDIPGLDIVRPQLERCEEVLDGFLRIAIFPNCPLLGNFLKEPITYRKKT